jgi:hypothetical protein
MFTIKYRDWFISGFFTRPDCYYCQADKHGLATMGTHRANTLIGAKRAITRALKMKGKQG